MSRRKVLPVIVIPVVLLLFSALFPGSGTAGTGGTAEPEVPWPGPYVCADGTLEGAGQADSPDAWLAAEIAPCAGADPALVAQARWGVAFYREGGAQISARTGTYGYRPDGLTQRGWSITPGALGPDLGGRLQAACLILGSSFRRACVQIDLVGGAVRITPLPTTDPLVTRKVRVVDPDTTDPICAGCV